MKIQMAPNSLFAILLRSPWWISVAIALAFGAGSRAMLPEAYWIFGAMGGIPFLVIALVAATRHFRRPDPKKTLATLAGIGAMSWREFFAMLEQSYQASGYSVRRLEGDADMAVSRAGRTAVVCARRWKAASHGAAAVQALCAAGKSMDADECVYISMKPLHGRAASAAQAASVQVIHGEALAQLVSIRSESQNPSRAP